MVFCNVFVLGRPIIKVIRNVLSNHRNGDITVSSLFLIFTARSAKIVSVVQGTRIILYYNNTKLFSEINKVC